MDYEKNAIEILRMIGSNNGFTVADSGGKDSSVLTHIAMKAGCPFEVVHKRGAFSTVLRENSKRHHSQKPECAYQMLETFFPQAKKLELFARAERDGWDQWGNEL